MKVLVTGATGVLGRPVVAHLESRGHEVLRGSRQASSGLTRVDLGDQAQLTRVAADVDAIVHCAADPFGKASAVEGRALENLRAAAPDARIVYPSIVGCDKIRFSYYKVKTDAERRLTKAGGDHAILRLTQFHEFADRLARLPIPMVFMRMRAQTIAATDAAALLADLAESKHQGRAPDAGGPETHRMVDLVKERLRADGRRRPVLRVPVDPKGFAAGHNLCPDNPAGTITWAEHLAATR